MASGLLRVALTGGIATGKSYCLARFAAAGAPTLDADELARAAVAPESAALDAIRDRFGTAVFAGDGHLDRAALGRQIFADPEARRALEAIIHPVVYRGISEWFAALEARGHRGPAIADIPLLYETGRAGDFDVVVATTCPRPLQISRLQERGLTAADAEQRLASQWPAEEKARRADYSIDTAGSFEETDRQVLATWARLRAAGAPQP